MEASQSPKRRHAPAPRCVTGAPAPQVAPAAFVLRQGALWSVLLMDDKCHRPIHSPPKNLLNCFTDANATLVLA